MSAAFSASMIVGALRLPLVIEGIIDESATRSASTKKVLFQKPSTAPLITKPACPSNKCSTQHVEKSLSSPHSRKQ